jgi:molybdopterin synthase catalytic subunit
MARLVREEIDIRSLGAATSRDGALCLFTGIVRDHHEGRRVDHLEYEAYEEMALPLMEEIASEARSRWRVSTVSVVHRLGRLEIGETSVAVAVTSPHRREAFEACHHVIDALKSRVPIWKKEFYSDGSAWIEDGAPCRAEEL